MSSDRLYAHHFHRHDSPWDNAPPHDIELREMLALTIYQGRQIMIDTSKLLTSATRATTDSASLRALIGEVKAQLTTSLANLAAAIAANDPVAIAAEQKDVNDAVALLDTDSTLTETALTANVQPAP